MIISAIVAVSQNGIIGVNGKIPWKLPEDMKRFKQLTMGHHLIMGRKTYESIGRPLPGRTTIVLSRKQKGVLHAQDMSVDSLEWALSVARDSGGEEVFICGGAQVYSEAMPLCDRLYLTVVERDFDGDTRFDYLFESGSEHRRPWRQVVGERSNFEGMSYRFETWER